MFFKSDFHIFNLIIVSKFESYVVPILNVEDSVEHPEYDNTIDKSTDVHLNNMVI